LRAADGSMSTAMLFFFAYTDKKARAIRLCSAAPAAMWCTVREGKFSASPCAALILRAADPLFRADAYADWFALTYLFWRSAAQRT
jgi:hypothetical protein